MKKAKLELRLRLLRPGETPTEIKIHNRFPEAEARERFLAMLRPLDQMAAEYLGDETPADDA